MSEWFKEPVLKTGDSQEPWVRIPLSPPLLQVHQKIYFRLWRSTQAGRRGAPAKGVGRETVARVQIPPSPPRRSKLCIACSDLFYKSERTHVAAPPFHPANAALICGVRETRVWSGASFSSIESKRKTACLASRLSWRFFAQISGRDSPGSSGGRPRPRRLRRW